MQQKNNSPQRKYVLAALDTAAVVLGTGYAFLGPGLLPAGESAGMQTVSESVQFIVNQGLGIDGTDGELYPMDMLVADSLPSWYRTARTHGSLWTVSTGRSMNYCALIPQSRHSGQQGNMTSAWILRRADAEL